MNDFLVNESAFRYFFKTEQGPWGQYLIRQASLTEQYATEHAEGGTPSGHPVRRTGRMISNIHFLLRPSPDGLFATIGSDARNSMGEPYPTILEKGGVTKGGFHYRYPWLVPALERAFGLPPQFPSVG